MSRGRALKKKKRSPIVALFRSPSFSSSPLRVVELEGGREWPDEWSRGMLERDITGRRTMEQLFEGEEGRTGGKSKSVGSFFFCIVFREWMSSSYCSIKGHYLDGTIISTIPRIDSLGSLLVTLVTLGEICKLGSREGIVILFGEEIIIRFVN